jgi:hypothetical protein
MENEAMTTIAPISHMPAQAMQQAAAPPPAVSDADKDGDNDKGASAASEAGEAGGGRALNVVA